MLRTHDLVLRYGGDEFLCAAGGLDIAAAGPVFARINGLLAAGPGQGSVTIGLAQLRPDDTSGTLIARADAQLYHHRRP